MNGIYALAFRGQAGLGMALLVLKDGTVCGADQSAVEIDGSYSVDAVVLTMHLEIKVPPGVTLAQGTPAQPAPYSFPIAGYIPLERIGTSVPSLVQTPYGPLNVLIRKLRELTV